MTYFRLSWYSRPNAEDQIKRKPDDQKNDKTTEKACNHKTKWYCFEPNIWSDLHLVNSDVSIEKEKKIII